ncbi:hypothetical protein [Winogradskyella sp. PE311]|uniref:hypothetical protein n=1 Tax=Winogradskyella sp. PE311 TaxID=3366943 RepID=UPI0039800EEA
MKYILTYLVFSFSLLINAQGQVEMNDIAHENYYQSQKFEDSLVLELVKINKNDSIFMKSFDASEKLWDHFVEKQFELKFPEYDTWGNRRQVYGSQFDMLYYQFMKLYCDLRISTLYDLFED